jgi:hypothetical protein
VLLELIGKAREIAESDHAERWHIFSASPPTWRWTNARRCEEEGRLKRSGIERLEAEFLCFIRDPVNRCCPAQESRSILNRCAMFERTAQILDVHFGPFLAIV